MISRNSHRPRVGLIGVSGYAQIYLDLLLDRQNSARVDLTAAAVVPRDQELEVVDRLRERGVSIYSRYEEMIDHERGKLDLYCVPTGIQWHARMTIAGLQAGSHVLVEKPLAGSLVDAEAVRACESATNRWVAVGFQDIYTEEVDWLKRQILEGAIGRVKSIRVIGLWPRSGAYYNRTHWAGRLYIDGAAALDSPLNNAFAHFVNMALYFAGEERYAAAPAELLEAELLRAHAIESFDTAVVTARSPQGVKFWFGVSHACASYREPEIHIEGERGRAEWFHESHCGIFPDRGPAVRRPVPDYPGARQRMLDAVLNRLGDSVAPICGTDVAIEHTRLIWELHQQVPILEVGNSQIEQRMASGHANPIPAIVGIEDLLDQAMRECCLLRETGFRAAAR